MSQTIEQAIRDTQQAFLLGVWPEISEHIGGGRIIPVEAVSDKEFLDVYAGIDHWHVLENPKAIRGIASRCQWPVKRHFQTFTIRIGNKYKSQTELAKRLFAMDNAHKGILRPHLFVQAYFAPPRPSYKKFFYAGIAKLDDILTVIRAGQRGEAPNQGDWWEDRTSEKWGNTDAKTFAVVPFETLRRCQHDFSLVDNR